MTEDEARRRAREYAVQHLTDLGERSWQARSFPGGWLLTPQGDDITWNTGVVRLAVLDDGSINEETTSLPLSGLVAKYAADTSDE